MPIGNQPFSINRGIAKDTMDTMDCKGYDEYGSILRIVPISQQSIPGCSIIHKLKHLFDVLPIEQKEYMINKSTQL